MKVGIKFCGGCNSRFDRGREFQRLKKRVHQVQWVSGRENEICDYWLVICGCQRICAETKNLLAKEGILIVKNPMDFEKVAVQLKKAEKKEIFQSRKELHLNQKAQMEKQIAWDTVSEFAKLTGDYNKMHMDAGFAAQGWFQKPIAHGMISASLLSSVMGMKLPGDGTILMEEQTKFQKPVYLGDTITAEITFVGYKEERIFYIGEFQGVCKNQNGEVVTEMTAKQMMMKNAFQIKK